MCSCAFSMVQRSRTMISARVTRCDAPFALKAERAVINPDNPVIAARHMQCAAAEASLHRSDPLVRENSGLVADLVRSGELLQSRDGEEFFPKVRQPHRGVALRGTGSTVVIMDMDSGERIGMVDGFRAVLETHPGAVYLHRGDRKSVV